MTSRSVCVGLASPSPSAARASIWPSVRATKKHPCKTCARLAANPCPSSGGLHAHSVAPDERNLLLKPISCSCRQRLAGLLGAPTASRKPQRAAFGRLENVEAPREPEQGSRHAPSISAAASPPTRWTPKMPSGCGGGRAEADRLADAYQDQAERRCPTDGLRAATNRQLPEDPFRMRLDGLGRDAQLGPDFLVGQSVAHQEHDHAFAR